MSTLLVEGETIQESPEEGTKFVRYAEAMDKGWSDMMKAEDWLKAVFTDYDFTIEHHSEGVALGMQISWKRKN